MLSICEIYLGQPVPSNRIPIWRSRGSGARRRANGAPGRSDPADPLRGADRLGRRTGRPHGSASPPALANLSQRRHPGLANKKAGSWTRHPRAGPNQSALQGLTGHSLSEHQLQSDLNEPGVARAQDFAERSAIRRETVGDVAVHLGKLCVIGDVEELGPELHGVALADANGL